MSVSVFGVEEVLGRLDKLANKESIDSALGESCALVERSAKQKAPKASGELRRSITSEVNGLEGVVFTPLEYAPYVEYGTGLFAEGGGRQDVPWSYKDAKGNWHSTSGQKPQPYMRPALDENQDKIVEIFRGALRNG